MKKRHSIGTHRTYYAFLLFIFTLPAYAQTKQVASNTPLAEALRLMDRGQTDSSIVMLTELLKREPDDYSLNYELAFANYLKKDYPRSIELLEGLIARNKEVQDLTFQLLGNTYDMSGKPEKAVETYKAGLLKFPRSGKLYLESGIMNLKKEDQRNAVINFQQGVAAEPMFASNYYWLSRLWLGTPEEVWGMLYGELFMNLESNSGRTAEISKLLFDKYKSEITFPAAGKVSVSFSKPGEAVAGGQNPNKKPPFGTGIYEQHLLNSLSGITEVNINTLSDIRKDFVKNYFSSNSAVLYPNVLFSYQKQILDAGHMDAYSHWVLQKGDPDVFMAWVQANSEKWKGFLQWFSSNRLKMNDTNKFNIDSYL